MMFCESQTTELKREFVPDITKAAISFANADGGVIYNGARSYESCRSLDQELSFDILQSAMDKKDLPFGESQMRSMKLLGDDGLYTNLALLLSDQCGFTTKVAIFQGKDKAVFRDRKEFQGSIIKQMDEVFSFLDLNNKTKAEFSGLERNDIRDYPEEAVREAWMNCIVHRDYSFSASTIINIFDDRIEFITLGGLIQGLSLDAVFLGVSQSRNPNLAAFFYRMHWIESFGTGIGKIKRSYSGYPFVPIFETSTGGFKVTLPNINETDVVSNEYPPYVSDLNRFGMSYLREYHPSYRDRFEDRYRDRGIDKSRDMQTLVSYATTNGSITRKEAEDLIKAGSTKSFKLLTELCNKGILKAVGNGRLSRYIPCNNK